MKKKSVVLAVGSALVGGLGVGVVGITTMASADSRSAVEISVDATVPAGDSGTTGTGAVGPDATKPGHRDHLESVLGPLVQDGTITQAQADKVIDAIVAAQPGGRGPRVPLPLDVVAKAIGITVETLRSELDGTKSIADVAQAHSVDVQTVIDALVADATTRIDAAVAAGKLTADQAATAKASLNDRVTQRVNNVPPLGKRGRGGHGGHHGAFGGPDGPPPADGGSAGSGTQASGSGITFA